MIWQVEKGKKGKWKTLNNSVIALLENAHQNKEMDVKHKSLAVSNISRSLLYVCVSGLNLRRSLPE